MLTAFQASTGAYMTEDAELLCEECFASEDVYARPVSNYTLDEWQSEDARSQQLVCTGEAFVDEMEADDDQPKYDECEPALLDANGHELREEYHYHPKTNVEPPAGDDESYEVDGI